jgi:hypothetical protein
MFLFLFLFLFLIVFLFYFVCLFVCLFVFSCDKLKYVIFFAHGSLAHTCTRVLTLLRCSGQGEERRFDDISRFRRCGHGQAFLRRDRIPRAELAPQEPAGTAKGPCYKGEHWFLVRSVAVQCLISRVCTRCSWTRVAR